MVYCHSCGKKNEKEDLFCSNCGKRIGNIVDVVKEKTRAGAEDIGEEIEEVVEKTSSKGLIKFIIFIIFVGYIILNFWAMSQLTPVISLGSILLWAGP